MIIKKEIVSVKKSVVSSNTNANNQSSNQTKTFLTARISFFIWPEISLYIFL